MFNDRLLKAARGEALETVPVWYMRQAGRSQPEYLEIKKQRSLFDITHDPALCAKITRLPVESYKVDAAILYQDIMTPLVAMGVDVALKSGVGPVIAQPIRTLSDVKRLGKLQPEKDLPYVLETIKLLTGTERAMTGEERKTKTRQTLANGKSGEETRQTVEVSANPLQLDVPLIGFSGAPFTLASYLIEGGPSKNYQQTKGFMYSQPKAWQALMDKLGDMVISYARAQIQAGVSAIQIFDSWVGNLSVEDYRTYIKPVMTRIFTTLQTDEAKKTPLILFGVGASHLLREWQDLAVDVIGLDWRTSIGSASWAGITKVLQGNLDPALLLAPWEILESRARKILDEGVLHRAFIFNLGHGVPPEADPAVLKRLTDFVHEYSSEKLQKIRKEN